MRNKFIDNSWIFGLICLLSQNTMAGGTLTFPGGAQSADDNINGKLTFECGAQLINNPSTVLFYQTVTNPKGCAELTCQSANCTANSTTAIPTLYIIGTPASWNFQSTPNNSGTQMAYENSNNAAGNITVAANGTTTLSTVSGSADYNTVTLNSGSTLNFTANALGPNGTQFRFSSLVVGNNATINLQPGDYWVKAITFSGSSTITVQGASGTARIISPSGNILIPQGTHNWNVNGTACQFLWYQYDNSLMDFTGSTANIVGLIYGDGQTLSNTTVKGSVTGGDVISFKAGTQITYDPTGPQCMFPPNPNAFQVVAPTTMSSCQNATVTVTAQTSGSINPSYTGTVTLDTGTGKGSWISTTGHGTFAGNNPNGQATYQFVAGDSGVATFQLSYPAPGPGGISFDIDVYQTNNANISGTSGNVTATQGTFSVVAGSTEVAGTSFPVTITAGCGTGANYTGSKTIQFYTTYQDPVSGTVNATINGTTVANSGTATPTTQTVVFTNKVATVTMNYQDAGKLSLTATDTAGGEVSGTSNSIYIKPDHFDITGAGIPGTSSANGAVFTQSGTLIKAGDPFAATITPRSSTGAITPNYGLESTRESVKLASQTVALPTGSGACSGSPCNGSLNNGAIAIVTTPILAAGQFSGTFSYDEVGSINAVATIASGNYMGAAGDVPNKPVVLMGRFIPDHFDVVASSPAASFNPAISSGATPFTYLEQPFLYSVKPQFTATARAKAGTTTQNYSGSLWKLTLLPSSQTYAVATGQPTLNSALAVATTPTCVSTGYGFGTCTFSDGGGFKFMKKTGYPLTFIAPFQAAIQLQVTVVDTDTVAYTNNPFLFGTINPGSGIAFVSNGNTFYQGRLFVQNAQGSELSTLNVPVIAQYYNGTGFVTNVNDNTTNINSANNITLTTKALGNSASFSTTATLPSPSAFVNGMSNIILSQPTPSGATGLANVQVNLGSAKANMPWLQHNWPYAGPMDGVYDDDPMGTGTFGISKGTKPYIFQQEKY